MPPQQQETQPGRESEMEPKPASKAIECKPADKLRDKVAIITEGDSGIGRAVAITFAKEGANITIIYLNKHEDAGEQHPQKSIEDISAEQFERTFRNNIFSMFL